MRTAPPGERTASRLQEHQRWWDGITYEGYEEACAGFKAVLATLDDAYVPFCRGRILEVGCGNGRFLARLRQCGMARLAGIDLSLGMLREGAGRGLRNAVNAAAEMLPLKDESFDTVISVFSVLKYADRTRALPEAARVLRPGGHLVFDLINYWPAALDALWAHYRRHGALAPSRALQEYTVRHNMRSARAEIRHLQRAGLDLVDLRSVRYVPFLRRRARRLGFWPGLWGTRIGYITVFACRKPPR
jgi:SAM-dependent methyltransferase